MGRPTSGQPSMRWTLAQLTARAVSLGLGPTGRKADLLAAILEHEAEPETTRGDRLRIALTQGPVEESVKVLAEEAGRLADRLDELDRVIAGKGVLHLLSFRCNLDLEDDNGDRHVEVKVEFSNVLAEARQQAGTLRQILATLGIKKDVKPGTSEEASPLAAVLALVPPNASGGAKTSQ